MCGSVRKDNAGINIHGKAVPLADGHMPVRSQRENNAGVGGRIVFQHLPQSDGQGACRQGEVKGKLAAAQSVVVAQDAPGEEGAVTERPATELPVHDQCIRQTGKPKVQTNVILVRRSGEIHGVVILMVQVIELSVRGQFPVRRLCSRIGAAACALSPEISDMAIANHILDLARRRAWGMHLGPSAITFKPGRERPLLLVSGEGQPRPGFRFTLRRKAAPAKPAVKPNAPDSYDAEPVPDYDAQPTEPKPQATPTGTITFERPIAQPAAPQPTPDPLDLRTAGPQAAAEARARRAAESELDPDLELCATRTIKISRADLEQAMAAQQAAKQQEQPNPEPPATPQPEPLPEPEPKASILDDDIPDFSAGLDPAALEAARKADEKAPPRSTDEFQRAASQLFEDDEDDGENDGEDEEPTITFPGRSKAKPAVPRPLAAKQEPKQDAIHNRSLAMIERAERRHRRKAIAAVAVIALLVLVGAAVLLGLTRGCTVKAPAYKNYGTEQFDTQAQAYLKSAAAENEKIIGYLAFPGQNGQLVYSGSQPGDGAAISGTNYLNASMPSNTVLSCADASLASLTDQTNFSQNAEFTLYLSDVTYHFRAVAVYNTDAVGTENAFTPASYGELSDYYSYAEFSQSIKERSLFDTGNTPGDKETFLTLMSTGGTNGTFVCVTAVLLPDQAQ